jgi:hypothetical protein
MKNLITVIVAVLASVVFLSSCKQDYTCTCRDTAGNVTGITTLHKTTKGRAKDACDAQGAAYTGISSCSID